MKNLQHFLWGMILLLLWPDLSHGQVDPACDFVIQGYVYDLETKEPLAYVNILLENTALGAVSDENGYFEFTNLCKKDYNLIFSYVGYKTVEHHHDFHHPFLEIFLAPEKFTLQSVVVEAEASRINLSSVSTTRLSKDELEAVASESLGDIVSRIAGVSTLSTGQNIVKPIIHGLHSNRILIMNNGLRHEFQNWGAEHAPEIDPSAAEEVEVVKGAATVQFGPDALGGVVLINPPRMELSTPLQGKVSLTGKSNGQSGEATAEFNKGFKWVSLLAGGSWTRQGDLHTPDYQLTNTGKLETSYYGGLRIHPFASMDIEAYYSRFEQTLGILAGSVFGNFDDIQRAIGAEQPLYTEPFSYDINKPRQEVSHDLLKLTASLIGKTQSLKLKYGNQFNRRQEFGLRRIDAPNIDLELRTQSLDLDWVHPSFLGLNGKFGAQWLRKANDNQPGTQTIPFIPNYDEERFGLFLIESLPLGDKHTLEMGLRYDYMDSYIVGREPDNTIYRNTIIYRNFSGTLGYKAHLSEQVTFRSNIGTAWRAPDVSELYRFGQHSFFIEYGLWRYTIDERFDFVTTSEGILDESDRAVPSEVGYKWINTFTILKPELRLELTGYANYIQNFIYAAPAGFTQNPRGYFVFFIYDQTDALFWGLDLSVEKTHNELLTSGFKGSYLWAKQLNPDDFFTGLPPARLDYNLTYRPKWNFLNEPAFKVDLSYTFEQWQHPRILTIEEFLYAAANDIDRFGDDSSDFDILAPPPAFFLTHLSWRAAKGPVSWQFQVRNLFDVRYRTYTDRLRYFADQLGRNFILTLTYHI